MIESILMKTLRTRNFDIGMSVEMYGVVLVSVTEKIFFMPGRSCTVDLLGHV